MAMTVCDISDNEQVLCFCPEDSCNFTTGSETSLLEHVEHVHQFPVVKFRYGTDFNVYMTPSCEFAFLTAEDDNSVYVLRSIDDVKSGHDGRLFWVVRVGHPGEGLARRTNFGYEIMAEGFRIIQKGKHVNFQIVTNVEDGTKLGTFVSSSTLEFRDDISIKYCVPLRLKQPNSGRVKLCLRIGVSNYPRFQLDSSI